MCKNFVIIKKTIKLLSLLTVPILMYVGCKDDLKPVHDAPKIVVEGQVSIEAVAIGMEITINFDVEAPAGIKSLSYLLDGMNPDYVAIPVASEAITSMSAPVKFTVAQGLTGVKLRVIDTWDRGHTATVTIRRVVAGAGIYFSNDVNSIDEINAHEMLEISGIVLANSNLNELFYTPFINDAAQSKVDIPMDDGGQIVTFNVSVEALIGMQKIEFTAVDASGNSMKETFTIHSVRDFLIFVDPASSKYWMRGETGTIKGQIHGSGITGAQYFIVKNKTEVGGIDIQLEANNMFEFVIDVDEYISAIRIVASNPTGTGELVWTVHVCAELTELKNQRITNERYVDADNFSFFRIWKTPHLSKCDDLFASLRLDENPNYQQTNEFLDYWELTIFQQGGFPGNGGSAVIAISSPAAWGQGVHHSSRGVFHAFSQPQRGAGNVDACAMLSRLNYMMISPLRPELEDEYEDAQTEADLWNLLDKHIESEGKTVRELFDPVTSSNTWAVALPGVYWIAWGPYNGSGKGGEKGNPAQNGGLGLLRINEESGVGIANHKWVEFDIKFPSWPNYRELFKDSWIDVRHGDAESTVTPAFPADFGFPGWPSLD